MKLFEELKRRNVFRVAGVYAVVAWLLIQIVVAIKTPLHLPAWTDTLVIVLFAIGFPIALILAWAFEVTPEGVKLTKNVAEGESVAAKTGKALDYAILSGLALVGVIIIADRITPRKAAPAPVSNAVAEASIAVLPFADLSPQGDQEYFADGIAEEILNVLARTDALKVASRTSAFAFKSQSGLSIPDIAAALGVRNVLEGSVRKSGGTIRITAQLIDAETDQHLWSQTFDRELTAENIFAIQDEISSAITRELAAHIGVTIDAATTTVGGTSEVSAYETFLKGREFFIDRNYENLPRAITAFEEAVVADPEFARAWGWLAMAYSVAPAWGFYDRDYLALAKDAAEKALAIDPQNTSALAAIGFVKKYGPEKDHAAAIDYFERAIAGDPQATTAFLWLAQAWEALGFFDRAEEALQRCLAIDPDYPLGLFTDAEIAVLQGRDDEVEKRLLKLFATDHQESYPLFLGEIAQGDDEVLLTLMLRELADLVAPNSRWIVTELKRALSDEDYDRRAAFDRFEARIRATSGHDVTDPYIITAYALAFRAYDRVPKEGGAESWWWARGYPGLRGSEYVHRAMESVNLPAYWRKHGFPPQCKPIGDSDFECD